MLPGGSDSAGPTVDDVNRDSCAQDLRDSAKKILLAIDEHGEHIPLPMKMLASRLAREALRGAEVLEEACQPDWEPIEISKELAERVLSGAGFADTASDRQDHELVGETLSAANDRVRLWRVTFDDPYPFRLQVIEENEDRAEAWLSVDEVRELVGVLGLVA